MIGAAVGLVGALLILGALVGYSLARYEMKHQIKRQDAARRAVSKGWTDLQVARLEARRKESTPW